MSTILFYLYALINLFYKKNYLVYCFQKYYNILFLVLYFTEESEILLTLLEELSHEEIVDIIDFEK